LVHQRFRGNRSAFAEAVGVSHTLINKVVNGQQPGRKLLTAITAKLRVDPAWLLTGQGQPFRDAAAASGRAGIPIFRVPPPGPPLEHLELVTGGWFDMSAQVSPASQYWLQLTSEQPILRENRRGFLVSDQLLMETDRARFPRESLMHDELCVVRFPEGDPPLKLATLSYFQEPGFEKGLLTADPFDLVPDSRTLITEEVYRHYPDGRVSHHKTYLQAGESEGKKRPRPAPLNERQLAPILPRISYADIVAVWLEILRRPGMITW
jgi:hypothetical protein